MEKIKEKGIGESDIICPWPNRAIAVLAED